MAPWELAAPGENEPCQSLHPVKTSPAFFRPRHLAAFVVSIAAASASPQILAEESADVIVYGATSGGITAAVEAARQKKSVLLIAPSKRIGGLTSGGLGWTDVGKPKVVGGLSREFFQRVWKLYTAPEAWRFERREAYLHKPGQHIPRAIDEENRVMWTFEPSVAEKVFQEMITEAGVQVVHSRLDLQTGIHKEGARITAIRMEDGRMFRASCFIDATYEGDLMAKAGVTYAVGRESNSLYNETLNGIQVGRALKHWRPEWRIDPYRIPGTPSSGLLPGINPGPGGEDGTGDKRVQAYCYRMTLTDVPKNRVPFTKPEGYNESDYELLFRSIEAGQDRFFAVSRMPNGKTDSNTTGSVSTDFIGMSDAYPEADYAARERIAKAHENWQRGLMWTLQNHPRVPEALRKQCSVWGLPKDEFAENANWSTELYVREARRMVGETVETERSLLNAGLRKRSIGMGIYTIDSHYVQRFVNAEGLVFNEGTIGAGIPKAYAIDYGAIVPKAAECENLLVPVAMSASHVAYGSIRMEPVFMILGHSAGAAAALAIDEKVPVQKISYQTLRARLLEAGQVLE